MNLRTMIVVAGCVLVVSCDGRAPESRTASPPSCDACEVRQVVQRFGERLQRVLQDADGWRIASFTPRSQSSASNAAEPADVLRRSVVDGASPEQRRWQIYRATLRATQ